LQTCINTEAYLNISSDHFMRFFQIILSIFLVLTAQSQKHDYNWVFGYSGNYTRNDMKCGLLNFGDTLNFLKNKYLQPCKLNMSFTNSSYSDTQGNLFAMSDGFDIYNKDFKIMLNGDSINFGEVWVNYLGASFPDQNNCVFLPKPGSETTVYLIHRACNYGSKGVVYYNRLYYSEIDMSGDSGNGKVISKNKLIFSKNLVADGITSVKHANGRDWWLIQTSPNSNLYYIFLIDPSGIKLHHEQLIGPSIPSIENYGNGNDLFSLDGNHYANFNLFRGILLMDFDRCTGLFTNPIHIPVLLKWPYIHGSVAFSSSGRFLYFNNADRVIQYDIWRKDFTTFSDTIAKHDGIFPNNISNRFGYMLLGPDGKIYASSLGSSYYIHCIEKPDVEGLSCNFIHRKIKLDGVMFIGMPPMPNYRLGALINSSCDTLSKEQRSAYAFSMYPNPVRNKLKVLYKSGSLDGNLELCIYNLNGNRIFTDRFSFFNTSWETDLSSLSPAVYIYEIMSRDRVLQTGKLIKD
jgi:hypothetical protein